MIQQCIEQLTQRKDLSAGVCEQLMGELLNGADSHQIAALLVLLRAKGETAEEVSGFVRALRKAMLPVLVDYPVLDIVGTGGDGANTINISTAASIVVASCGVKVAKHGSRSVSSQCGSSNVLDALGVQIEMTPAQVKACLDHVGIGFCFAPSFHPAWVAVKGVRAALGVRTVFNILGPLVNPANAQHLVIGVFSKEFMALIAESLMALNLEHAMVVHGCGLDELSTLGTSDVIEIQNGRQKQSQIDPVALGFKTCTVKDLQGGDAQTNARLLQDIFNGKSGPMADNVILNAAAGLVVADTVSNMQDGIALARDALNSGKAAACLANWVAYCKAGQHA